MTIGPNTVIENYKFIRKIGSGGMGEVFEAMDISLKRKVAIKILNPSLLTSEIIVKRFKEEAKILASLTHDNIVKVYSFFEFQSNYFMVMEYIDGLTLKEKLKETGLIPEEHAKKIILQILDALSYAHDRKIIHRDIKSSNIMISSSDKVKLMDFGIAKQLSEEFSKDGALTGTMTQMGTVHYMSPEQIKSTKGVDKSTDIFSLGVTFFEILTAKLPYDLKDKSDFEIQEQIVNNPLPDPRKHYPEISDKTISILKKMTEKDVKNRFQDCQEVKRDLSDPTPPPGNELILLIIIIVAFATIIGIYNKDTIFKYFNGNGKIIEHTNNPDTLSVLKISENSIRPLTQSDIYAANISDDLKYIFIATRSGELEQIDINGNQNQILYNYNKIIWSLSYDDNKNRVFVGLDDGTIQKFNKMDGTSQNIYNHTKPVYCLELINESDEVGFSQGNLFYLKQKNIIPVVLDNDINSIGYHKDSSIICFGDKFGNVKIYKISSSLKIIGSIEVENGVYSIEFIDMNKVILGCENGIISIWDITSKTNPIKLKEINEQKGIIKALKYDYKSNTLLSYSLDNTIFKWKINKVKA